MSWLQEGVNTHYNQDKSGGRCYEQYTVPLGLPGSSASAGLYVQNDNRISSILYDSPGYFTWYICHWISFAMDLSGPWMVVPYWHQLGTNLVPTWHQLGTKWVPNWHQLGTNLVPAWYQLGTNLVF